MLQITEQNISLKLAFQKNTGFNYDWKGMGVPNKGTKQSFATPFGNWDKEAKISRKTEVESLFAIKRI